MEAADVARSTAATLTGPEAAALFAPAATAWLRSLNTSRADPAAVTANDGLWSADKSTYLGAWHAHIEAVLQDSDLVEIGDHAQSEPRKAILEEQPWRAEPAPAPPARSEARQAIAVQRVQVREALARRRATVSSGPRDGPCRHVELRLDEARLARIEADMKRRFAEKQTPAMPLRETRLREMAAAGILAFLRGNELFDKGDPLSALAYYEAAAAEPPLQPFIHLNRGNAYHALWRPTEAAACYEACLDENPPLEEQQRHVHSLALLNLGTVHEAEGELQRAMQLYSAALALNPRCHLAAKRRGHLHMNNAERLKAAGVAAAVPPQHEMALNQFARAMEVDWQLPCVFRAGGVPLRLETRTGANGFDIFHLSANLAYLEGGGANQAAVSRG